MTIDFTDLRAIVEIVLDAAEESGTTVEINFDHYWDVPTEDRYDKYAPPTHLTIGQLSEDWSELQRIRRGEAAALPYALVWLASVLRCLGEHVLPGSSAS
jgi:hypothetical protein